jgi:hypothetical protein
VQSTLVSPTHNLPLHQSKARPEVVISWDSLDSYLHIGRSSHQCRLSISY